MDVTIRIDSNIQKLLKIKSIESGVTQKDLANSYLLKCLRDDDTISDLKSIEDIAEELNIPLINKLDDLEYSNEDIELCPEKESLSVEEIRDLIQTDENQTSNVNFTDMMGIVKSPRPVNSLDEKWESYD